MLKRKNEEEGAKQAKRVALDAEALDDDSNSASVEIDTGDSGLPTLENLEDGDGDHHSQKRKHLHGPSSSEDDPTYIHLRMLCQVKEASIVVGKGGETINHIKEASQARINVSDNIRGVPERVIHVMGPLEKVANAFGLITRAILGEDNKPSDQDSRPIQLQLLVQHQLIGYVIGKQGLKFREIEDVSASKLSASPSPLPYSTDRVLTISGVADSIHIAVYYVAQTILEFKSLVTSKPIHYNPATVHQAPLMMGGLTPVNMNIGMNLGMNGPNNNSMLGFGHQMPQHFISAYPNVSTRPSVPQQHPHFHQNHQHIPNAQRSGPQQSFIPQGPLSLPLQQVTQEIFIPNEYVGNVIGKSGKNIKQVKEASGSQIVIDPAEDGKLERKVTLIGSPQGNQTAIYLINNRIEINKKNREQRAKSEKLLDEPKSLEE